jgi:16S rRNA processing protein RimM
LAHIVRSQGRRGEVRAEVLTDFPQRLLELKRAWITRGSEEPREIRVRACRLEPSQRFAVFQLEGCDSIEQAELLVGSSIEIPLAERMPLAPGMHYVNDLTGCRVYDAASGTLLGEVVRVDPTGEETPGTPLLVVETPSGELLIPLAAEICRTIDTRAKRIEAALPEGLTDLNRT